MLYGHRSEFEATHAVSTLSAQGVLGQPARVLDAGCGAGHARALAKEGWSVGFDLSEASIHEARAMGVNIATTVLIYATCCPKNGMHPSIW